MSGLVRQEDLIRGPAVTGPPAVGTRDIHIGQELHVQADEPRAVAGRAAEFSGIVGEIARLAPQMFRVRCACVNLAEFIVNVRVGRHRGPHVDADGRGVNELDLPDSGRFDLADVCGKISFGEFALKPGHEAFLRWPQGRETPGTRVAFASSESTHLSIPPSPECGRHCLMDARWLLPLQPSLLQI